MADVLAVARSSYVRTTSVGIAASVAGRWGMSDFESRLEQCAIMGRGKQDDGPRFYFRDDIIECNLYRYAIVPLEDYGKYVDEMAEVLKEFMEVGDE
jgi:hypothetical protein